MKTRLPKRLMITCLIISPFFVMAQKQFSSSPLPVKKVLNFKAASLKQVANVSTEDVGTNPLVLNKINLMKNLSKSFFTSPLLPKSKTSGNVKDLPIANSFANNGSDDKIAKSPKPLLSFQGSKENKSKIYPPDPSGAVGPSYVMHTNNQEYVISDKTGTNVLTLPVDSFWNGYAGSVYAIGYPHVEYDAQLSHFYISTLGVTTTGDYSLMFGASVTNDPTGNWNLYALSLGSEFIQDAPQMGYSKRWFTMSTMQYDTATFNFNSSGVYLMSVAQMANGTLSSVYSLDDNNFFSISPVETQDLNINNHYLVTNIGSSVDTGYLYVAYIGGSLIAPTYNYVNYVTKASPWSTTPVYGSQNGTSDQIYLGNTKLRGAVYKNGHIFTSHTVYLPATTPTRAAAQYWDFTVSSLAVNQLGRVEDNNNVNMYGFPSLAVNANNDILLSYNVFSATTYPSAAYSYRNGADAANSLRKSNTYKKGRATYFEGGNAGLTYYWGSYTSTSVDPSDASFWTVQEYAEKPVNKWGTWWAHVDDVAFAPENTGTKDETASVINISPNPAKGLANISWNEDNAASIKIQICNAQGLVLITQQVQGQEGMNTLQLNISHLVTGYYSVMIYNGKDVKKSQLMVR
ncbi:MAG: T9SS type A sorting domain-containing protein [Bacteroidetes bacterium]|nr:T9SS type A sorting domain-containing protein [Bacteroidota bacterium]